MTSVLTYTTVIFLPSRSWPFCSQAHGILYLFPTPLVRHNLVRVDVTGTNETESSTAILFRDPINAGVGTKSVKIIVLQHK
jgi:hypothetical protein